MNGCSILLQNLLGKILIKFKCFTSHSRMQHLNTPSLLIRRIIQILLGQSRRNSWRSYFSGVPCRDDWLRISTDVSFRVNLLACLEGRYLKDQHLVTAFIVFHRSIFQVLFSAELLPVYLVERDESNLWAGHEQHELMINTIHAVFPRVPSYKIIATIQQVTIM